MRYTQDTVRILVIKAYKISDKKVVIRGQSVSQRGRGGRGEEAHRVDHLGEHVAVALRALLSKDLGGGRKASINKPHTQMSPLCSLTYWHTCPLLILLNCVHNKVCDVLMTLGDPLEENTSLAENTSALF